MSDTQQTPLQKWEDDIRIYQIIRSNQSDKTLQISVRVALDLADYAKHLEAEIAALKAARWPQGDDAARELARAMHHESEAWANDESGRSIRAWEQLPSFVQVELVERAAAVLARLQGGENDETR